MHLPDIFESWRTEKHAHRFRLPSLASSVIHDRRTRSQRMHENIGVDVAVAREQVQVYLAEPVIRTHQVKLPAQREVAQDYRPEFAESNETAHGLIVFGLRNFRRVEIGASGIGSGRASDRIL